MTEKKKRGRPKKEKPKLAKAPIQFEADEEQGLTEMQTAFVWHYTEGACGQTEAARRAGFAYPANAASKMLNGRDAPKVTKAIRMAQEELREKYAITPQKTGKLLWEISEMAVESGSYNAAVSAIKELNQLAGLTVHRSQNLKGMSRDDIKQRLAKLMGIENEMKDDDH